MQGDVLGDLNSRRGRVQGTDTVDGGVQMITALVPTAEIGATPWTCARSPAAGGASAPSTTTTTRCPPNLVERMAKAKSHLSSSMPLSSGRRARRPCSRCQLDRPAPRA